MLVKALGVNNLRTEYFLTGANLLKLKYLEPGLWKVKHLELGLRKVRHLEPGLWKGDFDIKIASSRLKIVKMIMKK